MRVCVCVCVCARVCVCECVCARVGGVPDMWALVLLLVLGLSSLE